MKHLIIGKPVETPKNRWRLHVETMHGDADAYTTQTEDFAFHDGKPDFNNQLYSYEELNFKLHALKNILALDDRYTRDSIKIWNEIEKAAKEVNFTNDTELFTELLPVDCTYNEYLARVEKVNVTFFDGHGKEFEVELDFDGVGSGPTEWTRK